MAIDGTHFPSRDHAQKWSTFQENWVDTRAPMYWPILSPGQQHPGYWLCRISFPCLPRGKVSSARVYSPLENGRKRRYIKTKTKRVIKPRKAFRIWYALGQSGPWAFKSFAPGRRGCNCKWILFSIVWRVDWVFLMVSHSGELCHRISLMISQHWLT